MRIIGRKIEKGIVRCARMAWESANFNHAGIRTAFGLTSIQEFAITVCKAESIDLPHIEGMSGHEACEYFKLRGKAVTEVDRFRESLKRDGIRLSTFPGLDVIGIGVAMVCVCIIDTEKDKKERNKCQH
jgi:hypothetical protein